MLLIDSPMRMCSPNRHCREKELGGTRARCGLHHPFAGPCRPALTLNAGDSAHKQENCINLASNRTRNRDSPHMVPPSARTSVTALLDFGISELKRKEEKPPAASRLILLHVRKSLVLYIPLPGSSRSLHESLLRERRNYSSAKGQC